MRKSKTAKIILDTYGNYLGMGRGCLVLKNEKGVEEGRYPLAWNWAVSFRTSDIKDIINKHSN